MSAATSDTTAAPSGNVVAMDNFAWHLGVAVGPGKARRAVNAARRVPQQGSDQMSREALELIYAKP
jgi:hypothetical protein